MSKTITPKEKAKHLVDGFFDQMFDLRDGNNASEVFIAAKKCALKSVEDVLFVLNHLYDTNIYDENDEFDDVDMIDFYTGVKQEIENL
jgi:hypothetical protein